MPQRQGQHPGRDAACAVSAATLQLRGTPQIAQQPCPTLLAVQQQCRVFAAAAAIGRQQGFELDALLAGARVAKAQGAAGAHGAAGAAAHTQLRVDLDLLAAAVAADGGGRADVDAGLAAHFFITAMGTQAGLVAKKFGFLEFAHQAAQLQQHGRAAAVPTQVTLRQGMLTEGRRAAQVQHQVKALGLGFRGAGEINGARHLANLDAGPVRLTGRQVNLVVEPNRAFGAGADTGIASGAQVQVNRVVAQPSQLKGAKPTGQRLDLAA